MTAATIPLTGDVARLVGPAAQHVENRSLLLDKFVFHKNWGLHEIKANDAHRWSLLRVAEGGATEIAREAAKREREADSLARRGNNPDKVAKLRNEALLARELARTARPPDDLEKLRATHTRRLLSLFLNAYRGRAAITIGQLEGRLAINLADSLIQNAGICLDRLFGLPYIPGSAVKGVCRHAALGELKAAAPDQVPALLATFCAVFGTSEVDFKTGDLKGFRQHYNGGDTDRKGAVSFLPAYPVNDARVVVDLTNVHYPDYYRGGRKEELSKENPRPNPFPAVETGAQFAFCLVLNGINNEAALLAAASRWLVAALTERGIGAKTAAGYGWFSIRTDVLAELEAAEEKDRDAAEARERAAADAAQRGRDEEARKATLSPEALAAETLRELSDEQFATFAKELGAKSETEQRAFITLLTGDKEKRERWKTWKRRKPELVKVIQDTAATLKIALP